MRAVVQRVASASVEVGGDAVGRIEAGLLVLLGVEPDDTPVDVDYTASKVLGLRVFEDAEGKMNRSVVDVGGAVLAVSQFTLLGDCRKGRRPSFVAAAEPSEADRLYPTFCDAVRSAGVPVETGTFRAHMDVALVNDGPVTLLLDSTRVF